MIRCRLELLPGGLDSSDNELLGEIIISNDIVTSIKNPRRGTYFWEIFKKRRNVWMAGGLDNFPRLSYHPWNIVREILNDAAERNGGRL